MIRRLLLLLLLLLPVPAAAQPTIASTFLEGSWGLRVDGSVIMRFDLELTEDGWAGAWVKPTSFASDGVRFGSIKMPATERRADSGRAIGEWAEITFDDPRPEEEDDQFRFRLIGRDRAEMLYVGTGLPPFVLERVAAGALLGPFEEGKVYGGPARTAGAAVPPVQTAATQPPAQAAVTQPSPVQAPVTQPPPVQRTASPPPARQPPPPTDAPVQGPPAMIGR